MKKHTPMPLDRLPLAPSEIIQLEAALKSRKLSDNLRRFIIIAINEHDELLQLLGEARDMLDNLGGSRGVPELQERIDDALEEGLSPK